MTYWSAEGNGDVNDEAVACTESVMLPNGGTYYRGRLRAAPGPQLLDSSTTDYGVWTATSKGGTKLDVVTYQGVPADGTEVAIDFASGWVYRTSSSTVYVYYTDHGTFQDGGLQWTLPAFSPGAAPVTTAGNEFVYQVPTKTGATFSVYLDINRANNAGASGTTSWRISASGVGAGTYAQTDVASGAQSATGSTALASIASGGTVKLYQSAVNGHFDIQMTLRIVEE